MCLTRKVRLFTWVGLLGAVGVTGGCKFHSNDPPRMNLNQTPLIVDEAMQKRDWERSTVNYANGDTVAGPHLIVIEATGPIWLQRLTDPAISTANNVAIPVTTILSPPWKDVVYQGMEIPPTYSAQPPPNPIR